MEYRSRRGMMPVICLESKLPGAATLTNPRATTNSRAGPHDIARESGLANSPMPTTAGMWGESRGAASTLSRARTRRDRMDRGGFCERATFIRTQHALGTHRRVVRSRSVVSTNAVVGNASSAGDDEQVPGLRTGRHRCTGRLGGVGAGCAHTPGVRPLSTRFEAAGPLR
jgi:hypothetical protein